MGIDGMGWVAVAPTLARLRISSSSPPRPSPSVLPPRDWGMERGGGQGSRSEIVEGERRLHRESVPRPGERARSMRGHGEIRASGRASWARSAGGFHARTLRGGAQAEGEAVWGGPGSAATSIGDAVEACIVGEIRGWVPCADTARSTGGGRGGVGWWGGIRGTFHRRQEDRAAQAEPCTTQMCGSLHSTLKE
jgi:hypothetical protein